MSGAARAYVAVSGALFVAILALHGWRLSAEHTGPLHDPIFVMASLIALVMGVWAGVLLLRRRG